MYYSASMFFDSIAPNGRRGACEEVIVLIEATSTEEAELQALTLSKRYELEFLNAEGELVHTKLLAVERVCEISGALQGGVELFSRYVLPDEADSVLTKPL